MISQRLESSDINTVIRDYAFMNCEIYILISKYDKIKFIIIFINMITLYIIERITHCYRVYFSGDI